MFARLKDIEEAKIEAVKVSEKLLNIFKNDMKTEVLKSTLTFNKYLEFCHLRAELTKNLAIIRNRLDSSSSSTSTSPSPPTPTKKRESATPSTPPAPKRMKAYEPHLAISEEDLAKVLDGKPKNYFHVKCASLLTTRFLFYAPQSISSSFFAKQHFTQYESFPSVKHSQTPKLATRKKNFFH